jgi:hypothetical protein
MKLNSHSPNPARAGAWFVRLVFALILMATMTLQPAFAQQAAPTGPMPVWSKMAVDAPPYATNMTDRALGFNPVTGQPCVAYGGDALYFSCLNSATNTWWTDILDLNLEVGQFTSMAYDPVYATPYILYYDAYNGQLKMAYVSGGTWHSMVVPDVPNTLPKGTAVMTARQESEAAASGDTATLNSAAAQDLSPTAPVVSTDITPIPYDEAKDQLHTDQSGAGDVKPQTSPSFVWDSIGYGKYSSIFVDRNSGLHISYYDEVHGALEYWYFNGIEWKGKVVDDYADQGDAGLWTSIKVDFNYNVHIAYMSEKYDDLKYAYRKATGGWVVEQVDTVANVGSFSSIALDSNFRPHIAYYDFSNDNLKHAYRDKNGVWQKEVVDKTGYTGWFSSIAIDSGNRIHISYYNVEKGDLRYARYENGAWTLRSLDATGKSQNLGLFTSIAIDKSGNVGIFYMNANLGALKFIYRNKNTWTIPTYVNYYFRDVGIGSSLAIRSDGVPFITYLDATVGFPKFARPYGYVWSKGYVFTSVYGGLYSSVDVGTDDVPRAAFYDITNNDVLYGVYNGVTWNITPIQRTWKVGQYLRMKLDSQNLAHFSYYDATHEDLIYASWNVLTSKYYTQTVDWEGTVGWYTDITLNSADIPFISYYDATNGSLKMARKSPITHTWIPKTIDNIGMLPQAGVGAYSSIGIDNLGRPYVSYYDITHQDLKMAYWEGDWDGVGTWNISVIDTGGATGDVGRFSDLVIYPVDNTIHVCYYDYTNGNLKYARFQGAGPWETAVVDGAATIDGDPVNEGDVGLYCSIDLDPAGNPAISYYDNSHADLKIAMSYPLPLARIFLPIITKEP